MIKRSAHDVRNVQGNEGRDVRPSPLLFHRPKINRHIAPVKQGAAGEQKQGDYRSRFSHDAITTNGIATLTTKFFINGIVRIHLF